MRILCLRIPGLHRSVGYSAVNIYSFSGIAGAYQARYADPIWFPGFRTDVDRSKLGSAKRTAVVGTVG